MPKRNIDKTKSAKNKKSLSKPLKKKSSVKPKPKTIKQPRSCGICKKEGHTRRTCQLLDGTTELYKHDLLIPSYIKAKKSIKSAKKAIGERAIDKVLTSDECMESFPCQHNWVVVILSDGTLLDFKRMPKDHVSLTYMTKLLGYEDAICDHLKDYLTYL